MKLPIVLSKMIYPVKIQEGHFMICFKYKRTTQVHLCRINGLKGGKQIWGLSSMANFDSHLGCLRAEGGYKYIINLYLDFAKNNDNRSLKECCEPRITISEKDSSSCASFPKIM